jgi:hypothetical protein
MPPSYAVSPTEAPAWSLRSSPLRGRRRDQSQWDVRAIEFSEVEGGLVAYGDDAALVVVIRTRMTAALHFQRQWVGPLVSRGRIRGHSLQESDRAKHVREPVICPFAVAIDDIDPGFRVSEFAQPRLEDRVPALRCLGVVRLQVCWRVFGIFIWSARLLNLTGSDPTIRHRI